MKTVFYFLIGIVFLNSVHLRAQRRPIPPINLSNLRVDFINVGARPAAMGGAFIGAAQDESAAPINPAGLTYLNSVGVSLHQRSARLEFQEPSGSATNPNAKQGFTSNNFDQNMVSVYVPLKKITFAIFRQVVFDSRFNFETPQFLTIQNRPLTFEDVTGGMGNFPGRKVDLDLEMVSDAFSVAYEISKKLSVGITGKISVLNYRLNEKTFLDPDIIQTRTPGKNSAETTYAITTVNERNTDPAFSFGIMAKLLRDKFFLGAVYHLNPSFTLKSNTFFPGYRIGSQQLPPEEINAIFRFSVPDTYGFGLFYIATSRLRFSFDVVRFEYSDLLSENNLNVTADDLLNAQTGLFEDPDGLPDLTVDDAVELHVGLEYLIKLPKFGLFPLRFGIHTNPQHRIYASGNNPDLKRLFPKGESRIHYTFGGGVVLTGNLKFDGSINVSKDGFEIIGSTLISIPF